MANNKETALLVAQLIRELEDRLNRSTDETRAAKEIVDNYIARGIGRLSKEKATQVDCSLRQLEDKMDRSTPETRAIRDLLNPIIYS